LLCLTDGFCQAFDQNSAVTLTFALFLNFNVGAGNLSDGVDVASGSTNDTTNGVRWHSNLL
jgi:hypothetical protein